MRLAFTSPHSLFNITVSVNDPGSDIDLTQRFEKIQSATDIEVVGQPRIFEARHHTGDRSEVVNVIRCKSSSIFRSAA